MIDTHAHLDAFDDPAEVVARAREAGVTRILTVGTDVAGCRRALELADSNEGVFAVLGIHPHEAARASEADVAEVRSLLAHPKAVGAGETGLDWFRDYASWVGSWQPSELPSGQALAEPRPLFRKLPPEVADEELARLVQ